MEKFVISTKLKLTLHWIPSLFFQSFEKHLDALVLDKILWPLKFLIKQFFFNKWRFLQCFSFQSVTHNQSGTKVFRMLIKYLIHLSFLILIVQSEESENDCKPGEFYIRLCCPVDAPDENCFDLSLMPDDKKLKPGHKIIKGKPCENMYHSEEEWEFLPVLYPSCVHIF